MKNITLFTFLIILFTLIVITACMQCKPAPPIFKNGVSNLSTQTVKIIPYKKGKPDSANIKILNSQANDYVIGDCYFGYDTINIDSVQVIFNNLYVQTHCNISIDSNRLASKQLHFNNSRNVLNINNHLQMTTVHESKIKNCESYEHTRNYIITEQDYLESKK